MTTAFSDLDERVDPKHTVLMVIDMQNDFCHQDGSPGRRGSDVPFLQSIVPAIQDPEEIKQRFPKGHTALRPYLRMTPQPNK